MNLPWRSVGLPSFNMNLNGFLITADYELLNPNCDSNFLYGLKSVEIPWRPDHTPQSSRHRDRL